MDGTELRRLRERLGLDVDELAAELDAPAAEVRAWEEGRKRIPRWQVEPTRWQLAMLERKQLLARSRLPRCAWFDAWEADDPAAAAEVQAAVRHVAGCPTCIRRRRYVEERLGPEPPFPEGALSRVLGPVADLFLPQATGRRSLGLAFLLPALLAASGLLRYATPGADWVPWVLLPLAAGVGLTTLATVFQGLPALREGGPAGRWAARALAIAAGVVGFGGTGLLSGHVPDLFGRPVTVTAVVVTGVVLGLAYSSMWSVARTHHRA